MTEPRDEETRPISVAELLARHGNIGSPPVTGRRRRRRGDPDSVSVAELTGEIPVIRDDDPPPSETAATTTTEPDAAAKAAETDEAEDVAEAAGEPRTARPARPPRETAGRRTEEPSSPVRFSEPQPRWPQSPPHTARKSGPVCSAHPMPAQSSSPEPESDAERMSPDPVDAYPLADLEADAAARGAVEDDIEDSDAAEDIDLTAETDTDEADDVDRTARARRGGLLGALRGRFGGRRDNAGLDDADLDDSDLDETDLDEIDLEDSEDGEAGADYDLDSDDLDLDTGTATGADDAFDTDDHDRAHESGLRRVLRGAWVVVQSLGAFLFGAALFVAFDQLWRWNSIVALVLTVLVTLGLVGAVQAVRKTDDIGSTLAAAAVGLLVTLGPLVFWLSG